jgi:hypothetical protein
MKDELLFFLGLNSLGTYKSIPSKEGSFPEPHIGTRTQIKFLPWPGVVRLEGLLPGNTTG